jgi:hypothetical protein
MKYVRTMFFIRSFQFLVPIVLEEFGWSVAEPEDTDWSLVWTDTTQALEKVLQMKAFQVSSTIAKII